MKVTMLLADHAQAAEGKLNIIGAGWTLVGPAPAPFAIAILFEQRLQKSKRQTTSNWALPKLDEKQLLYAANDAYAALRVHRELERVLAEQAAADA